MFRADLLDKYILAKRISRLEQISTDAKRFEKYAFELRNFTENSFYAHGNTVSQEDRDKFFKKFYNVESYVHFASTEYDRLSAELYKMQQSPAYKIAAFLHKYIPFL